MYWFLLDLESLEKQFKKNRWWSLNRFNLISLYYRDYIDSTNDTLLDKAKQYIFSQTRQKFDGQIYLFTHPRYLGFGFNSVNFYLCEKAGSLRYILSEINNTPWGEKHIYLHKVDKVDRNNLFVFDKQFHVSPFLPMDIQYRWSFQLRESSLNINMKIEKNKQTVMQVSLRTQLIEMNSKKAKNILLKRPFQPLKMFLGIYWQALKLKIKRVPFYTHSKHLKENE